MSRWARSQRAEVRSTSSSASSAGDHEADDERGVDDLAEALLLEDVGLVAEDVGAASIFRSSSAHRSLGRPMNFILIWSRGRNRLESLEAEKWLPEW